VNRAGEPGRIPLTVYSFFRCDARKNEKEAGMRGDKKNLAYWYQHSPTVFFVSMEKIVLRKQFISRVGGRTMTRGVSGFMKGIGMGIAVGCIAGAVGNSYMHSNKKGIKKNVGKALRNVGDLMDNVTSMF
jgi:hypothetical protein